MAHAEEDLGGESPPEKTQREDQSQAGGGNRWSGDGKIESSNV
jgi:hypothetical protein